MKLHGNKKLYKRIALALSLCTLVVWGILGTGASLAWFTDTSPEINNIFHFADFELEVSHLLEDGTWEKVDSQTKIFDEEVLYEPGYVQVAYLKVENKGDIPFTFTTAVNVTGYTLATNVFGQRFNLQDYLKFGLVVAETEEEMNNGVPNREEAEKIATMKLNNYATGAAMLEAGGTSYITLVVRMPKDVDNVANYRGDTVPKVELGIIVKADQIKN